MVIVEIQNHGSTTGCLHLVEEDRNEAESIYHTKLAVAAKSSVLHHSVVLLDDFGNRVKSETYHHDQTSEPEE